MRDNIISAGLIRHMNSTICQRITVGDMRDALLDLRKRTGDNTLSHTVKMGKFQLCRVVYNKRSSTVTPLSEYQDAASHLATLRTFSA